MVKNKLFFRAILHAGSKSQFIDCTSSTVDGEWSDYGEWGACNADCGGGTQTRTKTCTNPAPAYFGNECQGDADDSKPCNQDPCPGRD